VDHGIPDMLTWQHVALAAVNAIQVIALAYLVREARKNGKDK